MTAPRSFPTGRLFTARPRPAAWRPEEVEPRDDDDADDCLHEEDAGCDPAGMERLVFEEDDPDFVKQVREALRAEAAESPTAARLLAHAAALPCRLCVRRRDTGLSLTATDKDGNVTVHVNPEAMTGATMAHELGHVLQQVHAHHALLELCGADREPRKRDIEAAIRAGREALHRVVPVMDERDEGAEHKENEAMRISNIVNAERTATAMRHLPEALRTVEEFWTRQRPKECDPQHQHNHHPMPAGSFYGQHDFAHVKHILGCDADGRKVVRSRIRMAGMAG